MIAYDVFKGLSLLNKSNKYWSSRPRFSLHNQSYTQTILRTMTPLRMQKPGWVAWTAILDLSPFRMCAMRALPWMWSVLAVNRGGVWRLFFEGNPGISWDERHVIHWLFSLTQIGHFQKYWTCGTGNCALGHFVSEDMLFWNHPAALPLNSTKI